MNLVDLSKQLLSIKRQNKLMSNMLLVTDALSGYAIAAVPLKSKEDSKVAGAIEDIF